MGSPGFTCAIVAQRETPTTRALVEALQASGVAARVLRPQKAVDVLGRGDVALARLDVCQDLTGIEPGLWELRVLEREGVRVLNPAAALRAAHDKLAAARRFTDAGLAHPRTVPLTGGTEESPLPFPLVVKPRFGSWGRDVVLCGDEGDFALALEELRQRPWFRPAGGVVQELVPPTGRDLRVIVSGGLAVGAIERVAAPGEWRTNVALGGARHPVDPPPAACELAVAAAVALGLDLAGVDLLPMPDGGHVVLEVNGAPEFTPQYSRDADVFDLALRALPGASKDEHANRQPRPAHPSRTG